MTEIEKVISVARAEVGYLEKKSNSQLDDKTANAGSANYTKYARDLDNIKDFYNGKKNGYAWCDVFVDWCFVQAFGVERAKYLLCQPSKSLGAGTKYSAQYYKNKGQYYTTNPKVGDQVFFNPAHTGIVTGVDSTYLYTIEGNTSSEAGVIPNGGCVREKKYSLKSSYIEGFGRPKYADGTNIPVEEENVSGPTKTTSDDELLTLVKKTIRGDFGNGETRKKALGDSLNEVQRQVNLNIKNGTTNWDNIKLY